MSSQYELYQKQEYYVGDKVHYGVDVEWRTEDKTISRCAIREVPTLVRDPRLGLGNREIFWPYAYVEWHYQTYEGGDRWIAEENVRKAPTNAASASPAPSSSNPRRAQEAWAECCEHRVQSKAGPARRVSTDSNESNPFSDSRATSDSEGINSFEEPTKSHENPFKDPGNVADS